MVDMRELYLEPYAEDDALLNDWIDRMARNMDWHLFERQEDWVFMSGEKGEHRFPQFKDLDSVYAAFSNAFNEEISWLKSYMFEAWVRKVRLGNVDLGADMEWDLREMMGDEEFEEWESKARMAIRKEYAETLGQERTDELFEEAWGAYDKERDAAWKD